MFSLRFIGLIYWIEFAVHELRNIFAGKESNFTSPLVSLTVSPQKIAHIEGPEWQVQLKVRSPNPDSMRAITSHQLTQPFTTFSRLTGYCWLKMEYRNDCASFYSTDGQTWLRAGNIPLNRTLFSQAGIMVNSNLEAFTTKVKFDHVDIK